MTPERTAQLSLTGTMAEKSKDIRIKNMIDAVLKAAGGDYTIRLDISDKNDDLDSFAAAINTLIGRMNGTMAQRERLDEVYTESLDKYRHLVEIIPGMVYLFVLNPDKSFSFPYVSAASREMFGLDPGEIMNPAIIFDFIHPDDKEMISGLILNSTKTPFPFRKELRYFLNGNVRWGECIARPEFLPSGGIIWEGIILDITERKLIEDTLMESEKRYRMIAENAHDIIWTANFDLRMTFVSPSIARVTGYTPEEMQKMPLREHHDPGVDRPRYEDFFGGNRPGTKRQAVRSPSVKDLGVGIIYASRAARSGWKTSPRSTGTKAAPPSRSWGFQGTYRAQESEEALRDSEEKYRSILENVDGAFSNAT